MNKLHKRILLSAAALILLAGVARLYSHFQPVSLVFSDVTPQSVDVWTSFPPKPELSDEDVQEIFRLAGNMTFRRHLRSAKIWGYSDFYWVTLQWRTESDPYPAPLRLTVYQSAGAVAENRGLTAIVQLGRDEFLYDDGENAIALLHLIQERINDQYAAKK